MREIGDKEAIEARLHEHSELVKIGEGLCMSYLKTFGDSDRCQYCGFEICLVE